MDSTRADAHNTSETCAISEDFYDDDRNPRVETEGGSHSEFPRGAPSGFALRPIAVAEESWEELGAWLGLDLFSDRSSSTGTSASLGVVPDRFGGRDNGGDPTSASGVGNEIPWERSAFSQHRRVAQFGSCRYDYVNDVVSTAATDGSSPIPPIPDILRRRLLDRSVLDGMPGCAGVCFTQCIINVYEAEVGIPWHVDDRRFGPVVLVYTFGEARPLRMRSIDGGGDGCISPERAGTVGEFTAFPAHRCCYVLSGEAREKWEHSVPPGNGWRVSFTFRTFRDSSRSMNKS